MPGIARLTQTITVLDKSNKVVGASKQLKDVFHEAKNAYLERKAEIKAERKKKEDQELQKAIEHMSVVDGDERSPNISRTNTTKHPQRDETGRRRRGSDELSRYSHLETNRDVRYSAHRDSPPDYESRRISNGQVSPPLPSRSAPTSPADDVPRNQMIKRSRTDLELTTRPKLARSLSTPDVDLDLAYGDFHDGDLKTLSRVAPQEVAPQAQQQELSTLVKKCQDLLDEADCAQHSVRKIVSHLQSNPDTMAAVALTLAEISNVASKMAPGALAMFKTSAPAVIALLISPEFLIAVGVGVGITVVMFGGYKIVKKIKERKANSAAASQDNLAYGAMPDTMDEAIDVRELDRIEQWRRGIADAHAASLLDDSRTEVSGYSAASYTSVEGEIITPFAAQSMGHLPLKSDKKAKKEKEKKDKKEKKEKAKSRKDATSEDGSENTGRNRQVVRVKKPSPLRRMFVSSSSVKS